MSEVREDAVEKAKRLGLDLIVPGPADVFVDLDSLADQLVFQQRLKLLQKLWPDASVTMSESHTTGHAHAKVTIPELAPLSDHERIALQAALNSDPFREMLAIHHGRAGYKWTSVFFERKVTSVA